SPQKQYQQLNTPLPLIPTHSIPKPSPHIKDPINPPQPLLTLSSTTNPHIPLKPSQPLQKQTHLHLPHLPPQPQQQSFTFQQITPQPKTLITSPPFTPSKKPPPPYSPFTTNLHPL
ncbi:hypothetical protein, partial [Bacillus mycoides]|uniref:hypothetical protein n=1 Tax=Bacillus mycoides TaxID=1405 RepID=UPI001C92EF63